MPTHGGNVYRPSHAAIFRGYPADLAEVRRGSRRWRIIGGGHVPPAALIDGNVRANPTRRVRLTQVESAGVAISARPG
jgi:hypothetical protein